MLKGAEIYDEMEQRKVDVGTWNRDRYGEMEQR
jgi:hypothetical protein